jgi:hypothetical protein
MKYLFVIAVNIKGFVRYKHEILFNKYAKPNQKAQVVRNNRDRYNRVRLYMYA